jgi:peroxiredoxin
MSRPSHLLLSGLMFVLSLFPVHAAEGAVAVESGKPAPDFSFADLQGTTRKLSDLRGKVVVLEWLSPGCTYVTRHYRSGNMQDTQATAAAAGAVWLQVNSSAMGDLDPVKSREWREKQGVVAAAYIRDVSGKLGRLYGAEATPHLYVIAKDGTLVYQGAIDDQPQASQALTSSAHNYVKAALAALQAGRPVEPSTTQAYGCGVKYGAADGDSGR